MKLNARWAALAAAAALTSAAAAAKQVDCDILIAGGSAASLAAAIAAANATTTGASVCFLEATDWPGGQLTASAVSAVDFGANRAPSHVTAPLADWLWNASGPIGAGNPGACWVSAKCFEPQTSLGGYIFPTLASLPNLRVFLGTVVVSSTTDQATGAVASVTAVQRTPRGGTTGWEQLLSAQLEDWYSPNDSSLFTKETLVFGGGRPIRAAIDATEFGDLMMTAGLSVAQGMEVNGENDTQHLLDSCGQGSTIDFYVSYGETPAPTPDPWPRGGGEGLPFGFGNTSWEMVWSYRRVKGVTENASLTVASPGEISLQNWAGGNDFDNGYLFLSLADARAQVAADSWRGGVNITALAMAEQRAYGWWHAFKAAAPASISPFLQMNATQTGTGFGLAKMPYLRDARRAMSGLGGFRLLYEALNTSNRPEYPTYGTYWNDTVGVGNYNSDIHFMVETAACPHPSYLRTGRTLPYYLPFRALTHEGSPNLLVAGKNMAMSFWANAATRLHPEEWVTGAAAGAAAAMMADRGWGSTAQVLAAYDEFAALLQGPSVGQPLRWSE